jgi:hypothetical protein
MEHGARWAVRLEQAAGDALRGASDQNTDTLRTAAESASARYQAAKEQWRQCLNKVFAAPDEVEALVRRQFDVEGLEATVELLRHGYVDLGPLRGGLLSRGERNAAHAAAARLPQLFEETAAAWQESQSSQKDVAARRLLVSEPGPGDKEKAARSWHEAAGARIVQVQLPMEAPPCLTSLMPPPGEAPLLSIRCYWAVGERLQSVTATHVDHHRWLRESMAPAAISLERLDEVIDWHQNGERVKLVEGSVSQKPEAPRTALRAYNRARQLEDLLAKAHDHYTDAGDPLRAAYTDGLKIRTAICVPLLAEHLMALVKVNPLLHQHLMRSDQYLSLGGVIASRRPPTMS